MLVESVLYGWMCVMSATGQKPDASDVPAAPATQQVPRSQEEKLRPPPKLDSGAKPKVKGPAPKPEVKALVDRMQSFYEKSDDFTAKFEQKYVYKKFKREQTSSGTVSFKKPAMMRWEYLQPSPKTFVLAADKVYALDPAALTLTKAAVSTSQLSASVTFLWGKGNLMDEFSIATVACTTCQGTLLELLPKVADPRFKKLRLEVDPKTAQVLSSTVYDPDGSENTIRYAELKTNVGVARESFQIEPPPGTKVVDMTQKQ
jgi:outer membrane lipoprotein carrier protein